MGDKVKVIIGEINGTELTVPTEKILDASIVELDPPINGFDELQAFIATLRNHIDGGFANSTYLSFQAVDGGAA